MVLTNLVRPPPASPPDRHDHDNTPCSQRLRGNKKDEDFRQSLAAMFHQTMEYGVTLCTK